MRPWHGVALEQEQEKETAHPAVLEACVPQEDHPKHEDHRTHRREPLSMQPNTGIQCIIMECIIFMMHIKRIIAIMCIILC